MAIPFTEYPAASEGGSMLFDPATPAIWTARQNGTTVELQQFDCVTGAQLQDYLIAVSDNTGTPGGMTLLLGSIWFVGFGLNVCQIDPVSGALLNEYPVDLIPGDTEITAEGIDTDGTFLYVAYNAFDSGHNQKASLIQMDPGSGAINWTTIFSLFNGAHGPAFDGSNLWVNDRPGNTVSQLSTAGAILQTVPIAATSLGPLIVDNGLVTVLAPPDRGFFQVNANTFAVTGPFALPGARFPLGLAADPSHRIWINDLDFGTGGVDFDVYDGSTNVGTLVSDLVDTGGELAYDTVSGRMWSTGATLAGAVMIAMGFGATTGPGVVEGTHVGFWAAGKFGGGTK